MAAKKPSRPVKKRRAVVDCPNPGNEGRPYNLTDFLVILKNKDFAKDFLALLKRAELNEKGAIDCVNSYLAPTIPELESLGIAASQIENFRRCTDSGLLVMVPAQQSAES
jgi:hypothetical protein